MSRGGGREELTCCLFERSRRPGHLTGTRTWGCPASPSRAGNSPAASSSGTSSWGSSCVSCTYAEIVILAYNVGPLWMYENNVERYTMLF